MRKNRNIRYPGLWLLLIIIGWANPVIAATATAGESQLITPSGQLIDQRREQDKRQIYSRLALVSHKPNYLMGSYYLRSPQTAPFENRFPEENIHIQPVEIKFQLSMKTLLVANLIGKTGDLWVGYTNRSFWQAANTGRSAPFRETNHEPEVWLDFATDHHLGATRFKGVNIGMVHQSNGQWGALSRSWNRLYALLMFQHDNLYFALKPWWRLPESSADDNNPNIEKYLGNFEFYALTHWQNQTFGIMLRNNLRLDKNNHGALQIDYTFPLRHQIRGYVQIFSGYGESLIDYNHEVSTIGVGVLLANWL